MDSHSSVLGRIKENENTKEKLQEIEANQVWKRDHKIFLQARIQSHRLIESASEQANDIIKNAKNKAKEEYKQAEKSGYEAGFAQGRQKAQEEIQSTVEQIKDLLKVIDEQKQAVLRKHESNLKNLSLEIAQKIIETQMELDDHLFLSLYEKAIQKYNEQEWVKISVSNFEADFVTTNSQLLLSMAKGAKDLQIKILPNAPQGTCIVETPLSVVNASVCTQLHKLETAFSDVG
jgi:flagellar biosynthesis/type III secretory pathway protein FliH